MPSSPFSSLPRVLSAIKSASNPQEAMCLYKITVVNGDYSRLHPLGSHAAVFILKACCSASAARASYATSTPTSSRRAPLPRLRRNRAAPWLRSRLLPRRPSPVRGNAEQKHRHNKHHDFGLREAGGDQDIASWSAMIGGYVGQGEWAQAFRLFRELMWAEELKPDQSTLVTLLSCCAARASTRLLGKSIHAYCQKSGMEINVQLGTALVDMYAKSGCLRSANLVFHRMPDKNVMPWSAMICGLATHGRGEEAMAFFRRMKEQGVRPNEITFTGVLNACCHAGLVEEGKKNFHAMTEEFGLTAGVHHYGCVVDLLGKAGLLEEAYDLVRKMKVEPNIVILTSLLASCKTHRNLAVAEKLIERVLGMANPDVDGGVWGDAERIRRLMDRESVKKRRGFSAI
ncbi:unnamed protein product [Spirodela intermedia]|uniref:Uncharacterized protein n=1 Tax=Spirodela intermedia TaxID=51605 RepID=A0A7I8JP61_SPIIN|nr:unnamed protein product [Spirodela intermedia]CAA6671987.1 unnamed protein product [Spirodela intermedia]